MNDHKENTMTDPINPDYYKTAPENTSIHGECIDYATDLGFVLGSAFKYVWRAGRKGDIEQDLNKAVKLLDHAIRNGSFRGQAHLRMDLATPQTPRRRIMLLIAAANSAYDSVTKAAKQVAEIAEANVAAATSATVKAVSASTPVKSSKKVA